jgi:hypothetical protein
LWFPVWLAVAGAASAFESAGGVAAPSHPVGGPEPGEVSAQFGPGFGCGFGAGDSVVTGARLMIDCRLESGTDARDIGKEFNE